jgi:hypothetical protein
MHSGHRSIRMQDEIGSRSATRLLLLRLLLLLVALEVIVAVFGVYADAAATACR